jgi:hypothetical protein
MKYLLSLSLYHIGDIISRTTMQWFNGFGYFVYSKLMNWSVDLDENDKIWKRVKVTRGQTKKKPRKK